MTAFTSPVTPGTGWPDDPATLETPVAASAPEVASLGDAATSLAELDARTSVCRACPRLVTWREQVASSRRRAFADQPYWGRPVPGWGDDHPRILILGLAPAAHGGNRTGRIFTGDRSGDWLFAALHRAGLASLPTSLHAGDGQRLRGVRITAGVHCAPPDNKPTPAERDTCAAWLLGELRLLLPGLHAILALGSFAWRSAFANLARVGVPIPRPRPSFTHAAEAELTTDHGRLLVAGSYHPSQQNTFTGKLTEPMLDAVITRCRDYAAEADSRT